MIKSYEELIVWQKSMDLVEVVYKLVRRLPKEETYALGDQLRRAVVSIPSNIAEGQTRVSTKDFIRFLVIANGSCGEVETQLKICCRLKYLANDDIIVALNLCDEVGKMINSIITKLSNR